MAPLLVAFFAHQITLPDNTIVKLELWYISEALYALACFAYAWSFAAH